MTNKTAQKKHAMVNALRKTLGNITKACEMAEVGRTTYYEWMKEDKTFARDVRECEEMTLDFAESKLLQAINDGNVQAIIFYMKMKGKKRGYVERQELEVKSRQEDFTDYDDEDLKQIRAIGKKYEQIEQ